MVKIYSNIITHKLDWIELMWLESQKWLLANLKKKGSTKKYDEFLLRKPKWYLIGRLAGLIVKMQRQNLNIVL